MTENVSVITLFVLSGFNETKNYQAYIFALTLLCYCFILLVNVAVIVTVILDRNLHEPMYILLCTFCMNGLYGTTGFYPKFLWDLLSPVHVISYSGCLIQALVMYSFACSDLSILAIMAYDRYVAICRPLQYNSIMSKQRVILLVCFSWLTPFCIMAISVVLTSRLKLCSPYIARLFCVNWIIVKLACFPADTLVNNIVAYITILIYVFHGLFIVWSYMYLIKTCVHSKENRAKFMQTCVPHLISLITFLVAILFDVLNNRIQDSKGLPQMLQNFIAIEFLIIPPMMNPLIYGFKLSKIRNKIIANVSFKIK
ncbi:olfactory receptor 11H6-like [Eleginops maclovinus]|uniref:olfactory receptor 11H6-like n=1 Tax=Eleginops maclovinus TaxID=56733 RepID=UPI0030805DF0